MKKILLANNTTEKQELSAEQKKEKFKRILYNIVFAIGWAACLPIGKFPQFNLIFSVILAGCIAISFFDDNFYLYAALFMYMRYRMLIGETPVYRIYSYLLVIKFLIEFRNIKFRILYAPAILVFALHCLFALGRVAGIRLGLNALVDFMIIYLVLAVVLQKEELFRKFILAYILGGILSGVYGWTNADVVVDINIRGAGSETASRNFGSLGDPNFAGLYYITCFYASLILKNINKWIRLVFLALFIIMLLQTASLSAIITLILIGAVVIVLKFRGKSIVILAIAFVAAAAVISVLMSIPQFRELPTISSILIRVSEKMSYISMGKWDLLTTDRYDIWQEALNIFQNKSVWGKLFGGSVITVMFIDESLISIACHQSIIQALLDFGVLGTAAVYIPFLGAIVYRLIIHFQTEPGSSKEDIGIIRIVFPICFLVFGMTVDFFIDWAYLFFYFI